MLGEVNVAPDQLGRFFGDEDGDELQMPFNFPAMQGLYLGLARQGAQPFIDALRSLPAAPAECQWASFVRNHDELTLDKLTDDKRRRQPAGSVRIAQADHHLHVSLRLHPAAHHTEAHQPAGHRA